jgi:putative CocE/NonD family hydrolase
MYKMQVANDVCAKMRDGVKLACDIYRPDAKGKFPAILTMLPYCKDVQALKITPRPFNSEYASLEKGNSEFLVARGYAHVVADIRGSGKSEGNYDIMSKKEQEDGYDLVEWIAEQPWCDGNVGMIGISYPANPVPCSRTAATAPEGYRATRRLGRHVSGYIAPRRHPNARLVDQLG